MSLPPLRMEILVPTHLPELHDRLCDPKRPREVSLLALGCSLSFGTSSPCPRTVVDGGTVPVWNSASGCGLQGFTLTSEYGPVNAHVWKFPETSVGKGSLTGRQGTWLEGAAACSCVTLNESLLSETWFTSLFL